MHFLDFTDKAKTLVLDAALQQTAVHTGQADSFTAFHLQQVDQRFVDLPCKDHLDDIHGFFIRDTQTSHKLRLFAEAIHEIVDFRAAAVYQYHTNADKPEQDDIFHDLFLQLFIDHGVAAVFDDNDLTGIFPDVGKGCGQDFRPFHICQFILHLCTSACNLFNCSDVAFSSGNRR